MVIAGFKNDYNQCKNNYIGQARGLMKIKRKIVLIVMILVVLGLPAYLGMFNLLKNIPKVWHYEKEAHLKGVCAFISKEYHAVKDWFATKLGIGSPEKKIVFPTETDQNAGKSP